MSNWRSIVNEEVTRLSKNWELNREKSNTGKNNSFGLCVGNCGVVDVNDLTEDLVNENKEYTVTFMDRNHGTLST